MLSPERVRTEHIARLTTKPSGQLLTINKAVLDELEAQQDALLAAIERANNRAAGVKRGRSFVATVFAMGMLSKTCSLVR